MLKIAVLCMLFSFLVVYNGRANLKAVSLSWPQSDC